MTYDGTTVVPVPGVRVPLAAVRTPACFVVVQALLTNGGAIYVGGATVTAATGFELPAAGNWFTFPPVADLNTYDLSQIYIDAAVGGEGVKFLYHRR